MRKYRIRPMFHVRRRMPSFFLPFVFTMVASICAFHYISVQLTPVIKTLAESKVKNFVSQVAAEAVADCLFEERLTYSDLVAIDFGPSGQVRSLSFRTAEGAAFKRNVTEEIVDHLELISPNDLEIPIGTLSGILFLSSLGPSVRVKVQSVGDVFSEFKNEFTSAGVNQTRHAVYLELHISMYILIPGEVVTVNSCERICVAETIIVGDVPDTYLNLQNGVQ